MISMPTIHLSAPLQKVQNEYNLPENPAVVFSLPAKFPNHIYLGHNQYYFRKAAFANLRYLKIGDKIIIKDKIVKVIKTYVVAKDSLDISFWGKPRYTFITCEGFFFQYRRVVVAK